VAATSTPSFDASGVWFNFRVLRAHEPGAVRKQSDPKRVPTFIVASVSIGFRAEWTLGLHRDARPAAVLAPTSAAFCWVISSIWLAAC
jgi:hypothetical protein